MNYAINVNADSVFNFCGDLLRSRTKSVTKKSNKTVLYRDKEAPKIFFLVHNSKFLDIFCSYKAYFLITWLSHLIIQFILGEGTK